MLSVFTVMKWKLVFTITVIFIHIFNKKHLVFWYVQHLTDSKSHFLKYLSLNVVNAIIAVFMVFLCFMATTTFPPLYSFPCLRDVVFFQNIPIIVTVLLKIILVQITQLFFVFSVILQFFRCQNRYISPGNLLENPSNVYTNPVFL